MSSSHEGVPNHGSALTAGLFVCPFWPRFFHHIHLTSVFVMAMIGSTRHWWLSGRIFTYQAGGPGSIPAGTSVFFWYWWKNVNDTCQKSLSYIGPDKKVLFFVTLFLSLIVRNKGRKKKKSNGLPIFFCVFLWLKNIGVFVLLPRFSYLNLKSLRQTNAHIQVFIGSVSYRWFDWGSLLMKSKFSWRLLYAILISFFVVIL